MRRSKHSSCRWPLSISFRCWWCLNIVIYWSHLLSHPFEHRLLHNESHKIKVRFGFHHCSPFNIVVILMWLLQKKNENPKLFVIGFLDDKHNIIPLVICISLNVFYSPVTFLFFTRCLNWTNKTKLLFDWTKCFFLFKLKFKIELKCNSLPKTGIAKKLNAILLSFCSVYCWNNMKI